MDTLATKLARKHIGPLRDLPLRGSLLNWHGHLTMNYTGWIVEAETSVIQSSQILWSMIDRGRKSSIVITRYIVIGRIFARH